MKNDFCRPVGDYNNAFIACKLAGSDNEYTVNYGGTEFNSGFFSTIPKFNLVDLTNLPNNNNGVNCDTINPNTSPVI